ncbi:MAG TPA: AAA family ATPase [Labilithrix sp.]|nr:AAA family ATPase [Labilithrix sp.]
MERASLDFRVLGELEVARAGRLVPLPQSKKTRALLAYLVLTDREHRRERLCDLFWDVADDRRGALRWSLSKLRAIVDDDGASRTPAMRRIRADRERVSFVSLGTRVDALELRRELGSQPIETIATEVLERWAAAFRGELLEGLDLADFDDYQAWCIAEREQARTQRVAFLAELVRRLQDDPARAVEHARVWVQVDPLDERARAPLVRLLAQMGKRDEARQHYEAGRRLEKELGRGESSELGAAWREVEERVRRVALPSAPVSARALSAPTAEPNGGPPRLVGRGGELSLLDELSSRVETERRLAVIVVSGEPGVGKTRLLDEWLHREREAKAVAVRGAAYEAESGHPYGPWIDALNDAKSRLSGLESAADIVDLFDGGLGTRERLFSRVSNLVAEITSRSRRLSLVLDDAQWLDEGSAEVLHWVARTNRDRSIVIALSTREGELADNSSLVRILRGLRREGLVQECTLGPLTEAETVALVRDVGGRDVPEVHARTGGNPLFAIELARSVSIDSPPKDGSTLPPSLGGLVRDRVAQLPEGAAHVIRWAAVLGATFRYDRLAALSTLDEDALVTALEQLERRALLVGNGLVYSFAHDIVRQVVYSDLSEPRRRLMHQRVARMLASTLHAQTGDELAPDVAHHAALAHDAALAVDASLGAARRSLRVFANADVFGLARRGVRYAERLDEPERTKRLLELAEVALAARRPDDPDTEIKRIEALAERALDLGCPEHARLGFHLVSILRWERGGWSEARKHMLQAELVSRGASEVERVRGMAEAARCLVLLERDLSRAHALALEAAARGRQVGVEPSATFDALGMLELHRGRVREAEIELERARGIARSQRDHYDEFQALEHLVMLELERGDFAAALRLAEELVALGERFREGSEAPFARALVALSKVGAKSRSAARDLDHEIEALTVADAKHRLAYVLSRSAWLDIERGGDDDVERARTCAERALSIARLLERSTEQALAHDVLLRCAVRAGDNETAQAHREALDKLDAALIAAPARARMGRAATERKPGDRA